MSVMIRKRKLIKFIVVLGSVTFFGTLFMNMGSSPDAVESDVNSYFHLLNQRQHLDNAKEQNSNQNDIIDIDANDNMHVTDHKHLGVPLNKTEKEEGEMEELQKQFLAVVKPTVKPTEIQQEKHHGDYGHSVHIKKENLSKEERDKYDKGWKDYAFNEYVSNMISLHRPLPEIKMKQCLNKTYPAALPDTSVIICFHNEAWSTLLRTVHSVLDNSPPHLIKEIILVDDASVMAHLMKPLENYLEAYPKVKIVRTGRREGLIRARLQGANKSSGSVLTYLDSHCECYPGWLEPLLARIAENSTNVVCPIIEVINDDTFKTSDSTGLQIGTFGWDLIFNWMVIPPRLKALRKDDSDPLPSPTMAGGLFAIDRKWFEKLGLYDPGFEIWGGENLELSFKTWMCGGQLDFMPCSHVGHVFRSRSPYGWGDVGGSAVVKNSVRLAQVWLDDYAHLYLNGLGGKIPDVGDISERVALRKGLQCKSFDWYMKTVIPEHMIPYLVGPIASLWENRCLDSHSSKSDKTDKVIVYPCHTTGGAQTWEVSEKQEIIHGVKCLDAHNGKPKMSICHHQGGNQKWIFNEDKTIRTPDAAGNCLTVADDKSSLAVENCDVTQERFLWNWPSPIEGLHPKT